MKIKLCAVLVIAAMACGSAFALDGMSFGGSLSYNPVWPAVQLNANQYVDLANNWGYVAGNWVFGARTGSLDAIYYSGGWQTGSISSNTYSSIAANGGAANWAFGARAGSLDEIVFNGSSWDVVSLNSNTYTSLATNRLQTHYIFGARNGGVDAVYFNGSYWATGQISNTTYSDIITDAGQTNSFFGIKSGGVERVKFNGSVWATETINTNQYVSIAADKMNVNWLYGAKANGDVDVMIRIAGGGGAWQTTTLYTGTAYKSLETYGNAANAMFAARADGTGLDVLYWDGSVWTKYLANSNNYDVLLHDGASGNLFASVPEPATLVILSLGGLLWGRKRK